MSVPGRMMIHVMPVIAAPRQRFAPAASCILLALLVATPARALDLFPLDTTGFDQDIIFEAGLTAGQVGANGELGSRQFFEEGVFADGVPRSIVDFVNPLSGNVIDFNFAPFEGNNILKFDTTMPGPKTLTLAAPGKAGQLAIVHSGGSMAISGGAPTDVALVSYTINYVGGATETGTFSSVDWGNIAPENMPAGTAIFFNADRSTANATTWPINSDNNTQANRWSIYVSEITPLQPTVNIESVSFGPISLNNPGTPLNSGDDVVIFGLSAAGEPPKLGDTDGDGVVEFEDDFGPIRNNFRKMVTTRAQGDLVRNGVVDFADFRQWKGAFTAGGGSLAGVDFNFLSSVPEPSAALLALVGLAGRALGRGKRPMKFCSH